MNFSLDDDQRLLQESVNKFLAQQYDHDQRRARIDSLTGVDKALWQQMAEAGWLALPFAEEHGGLGGRPVDTMVLMQSFGESLVVEPYAVNCLFAGQLLAQSEYSGRDNLLADLIAGAHQLAVATDEYENRGDVHNLQLAVQRDGNGLRLNGVKACVYNGSIADTFLVLVRDAHAADGFAWVVVPRSAEGVDVRAHRSVDGMMAAELRLNHVFIAADQVLTSQDGALALYEHARAVYLLGLGAEAVGMMDSLVKQSVEYLKTREQFGVPIGSFQVLQHRAVNMYIAQEQGQSLLLAATLKWQEGHDDAHHAIHALKAYIGTYGRLIGQDAVQLHGGMGMTHELKIGHYLKRLLAVDALCGNARVHLHAMMAA